TPTSPTSSTRNQNEAISNALEIKARGGYIIGVNHQNNPVFDYFIKIPDTGDLNPADPDNPHTDTSIPTSSTQRNRPR
ncbi:hypothetical protein DRO31_07260, partial [Candidatus Bathyarchaeota archaeon]